MSRVRALARKESGDAFRSPVAYAVAAFFLLLSGFFFRNHATFYHLLSIRRGAAGAAPVDLRITPGILQPLYESISFLLILIVPLLTMRLLAEEKRNRSFELLLAYPVKIGEAVVGKFLGAFFFYVLLLLPTLAYPVFLARVAEVDPGAVAGAYLGLLLLGGAYLALGLFVSSLTESPIVAAAGTYGALLLAWTVGYAATLASPPVSQVMERLSFLHRFGRFTVGLVDTGDVVFFIAWIVIALAGTDRVLRSRRWRG
ncbi:MAG: ABC transporter permease [Candidatus Eisenbacteria bacterium]|nr:ABC transporter permease [Candidatus Eisenbacteria bacterium]